MGFAKQIKCIQVIAFCSVHRVNPQLVDFTKSTVEMQLANSTFSILHSKYNNGDCYFDLKISKISIN